MYHGAFYYGYDFSDEIIHKYRINMKKIETFPRLQYNISLFMKLGYTEDEIFKYDCAEQLKRKYYNKFVDKIIKFENISEVNKIMKKIDKLYHNGSIELDVECFMDIFLSLNKNIEKILEEYCTNPNKYKYIFFNVKEAYLRFSNNEKLLKILKKLPISKKDLDILNDENQHLNVVPAATMCPAGSSTAMPSRKSPMGASWRGPRSGYSWSWKTHLTCRRQTMLKINAILDAVTELASQRFPQLTPYQNVIHKGFSRPSFLVSVTKQTMEDATRWTVERTALVKVTFFEPVDDYHDSQIPALAERLTLALELFSVAAIQVDARALNVSAVSGNYFNA